VDATLVWTAVGSGAAVAGVAVAIIVAVAQSRSGRKINPKVTAELAYGQLAQDGVLYVKHASGKTDVIMVPKPGKARTSARRKPGNTAEQNSELKPVNAIFVRNQGRAAVTVSRCHYVSDLGGVGFRFEPQPAASPRGDHFPMRMEPGENAVLLHDLTPMRAFLNQVLRDHGVYDAQFEVMLTLGHGLDVVAHPSMHVQANMSDQEMAATGTRLERQEISTHSPFAPRVRFERGRRRRRPPNS
jgi:hypothetical protein